MRGACSRVTTASRTARMISVAITDGTASAPDFSTEVGLTWPLFPLGPLGVQVRKAGTIAWR